MRAEMGRAASDRDSGPEAGERDDGRWGEGTPPPAVMSAETYEEMVTMIVAENAPRRFAVVQDWGDHVDGRVAAWGMAFPDHVDIVDAEGGPRMRLTSPRLALIAYSRRPDVTARLMWIDPEPDGE